MARSPERNSKIALIVSRSDRRKPLTSGSIGVIGAFSKFMYSDWTSPLILGNFVLPMPSKERSVIFVLKEIELLTIGDLRLSTSRVKASDVKFRNELASKLKENGPLKETLSAEMDTGSLGNQLSFN